MYSLIVQSGKHKGKKIVLPEKEVYRVNVLWTLATGP